MSDEALIRTDASRADAPAQRVRSEDLVDKPGIRYTVRFRHGDVEMFHLYPQDGDTMLLRHAGTPNEQILFRYASAPGTEVVIYTRGVVMYRPDGFVRKVRK